MAAMGRLSDMYQVNRVLSTVILNRCTGIRTHKYPGDDFKDLAGKSKATGIVFLSDNLTDERIDTKLTALLSKSTPNALYGKFTTITGET